MKTDAHSTKLAWFISFICLGTVFFFNSFSIPRGQSPLKAYFPVEILRQDESLLDPTNTEKVSEFYLLENLSAGIVEDDMAAPSGYIGVLAESWKQESPTSWSFQLKPELKWSDGSPMTAEEIADELKRRQQKPSRHTVCLRYLTSIDTKGLQLTLHFSRTVGDTLIHELNLADNHILHKSNYGTSFRVSSGAYKVKSLDFAKLEIVLEKNPFYPQKNPKSPDLVTLNGDITPANVNKFFGAEGFDLLIAASRLHRPMTQTLMGVAPYRFTGMPSSVYYAIPQCAPELSPEACNSAIGKIRAAFKNQFAAFADWKYLQYEDQMIPPGYSGRVLDALDMSALSPKASTAKIQLHAQTNKGFDDMKEILGNILKPLASEFASVTVEKDGAKVSFPELLAQGRHQKANHIQLLINTFRGNQRDSVGNWAFLTSHGSPLEAHAKVINTYIEKAIGENFTERTKTLTELHKKVLEKGWLIPFAVEGTEAFHSDRVSLKQWNRFDMRPRFYDLEML